MANTPHDALRFYGVVDADGTDGHARSTANIALVQFRDLAAVVVPTQYVRVHPDDQDLADYTRVIDELYTHGPIVPAPPGTVFRDAAVLRHWLEIHYAKLHEALGFVEQRASPIPPYDFIQMELGA